MRSIGYEYEGPKSLYLNLVFAIRPAQTISCESIDYAISESLIDFPFYAI